MSTGDSVEYAGFLKEAKVEWNCTHLIKEEIEWEWRERTLWRKMMEVMMYSDCQDNGYVVEACTCCT